MRTLLPLLLCLSGCVRTAESICDGIPLGTPIVNVWDDVTPAPRIDSWCGGHPQRAEEGMVTTLRCCSSGPSDQCRATTDCSGLEDTELFSVGPVAAQQSDTAQCCVLVRDGKVAARYVAYD